MPVTSSSNEKNTQQLIEFQLLDRLHRSDESALIELMRAYVAPLSRFAFHYVHSREIAEELVQDVFLRVWEHRTSLDPMTRIKSYLFIATRNSAISHLRHVRVERSRVDEDAGQDVIHSVTPQSELEGMELQQAVQKAVNALPERCRLIFNLHREEGLTYAEIASVLGISIKTVETQMVRALKTLRSRLASYLPLMAFFGLLSDRLS